MVNRARHHDDDIEVGSVEGDAKTRLLCPITRDRFVHPVKKPVPCIGVTRSITCNHTYSREAIVNLIGGKRSVKCPVKGCNKNVSLDNLVDDEEMIWLLVGCFASV